MARRNVVVENRSYVFSPDDPIPLANRYWALLRVQVIDELTGRPARGDMGIETDYPGLLPRVAADGLLGLVGRPLQAFPALNPLHPSAQTYDLIFTVRVAGYLRHRELVTFPMIADFPNAFFPRNVTAQLRRQPIVIRGRTVEAVGNTTNPLPGMTVSVTGIRPTVPPGNVVPPPPDPPRLLSLRQPLYLARTTATGVLRQRELNDLLGQDKRLLQNVAAGDTLVHLSDGFNLNPGNVIAIDVLDADWVEFITIDSIAPSTTTDSVSRITLAHPLARRHNRDVLVRRMSPQAPGFNNPFTRDAQAGDTCVFLNSMTDLAAANVVEVSGALGDPVEFHSISRFTTTSDVDGYFRLPLLSRVAELDIQVDDGGVHPTQTRTLIPNYEDRENRVDFIF